LESAHVRLRRRAWLLLLSGLWIGTAACIRYTPKTVAAAKTLDDFEARRLDSAEIRGFFKTLPGTEWPPPAWDLKTLTLAALYYHPDLDVVRAQWATARAGRVTAGERPNPTASVLLGYNSTTSVSEVTPWIPEAALEIPIETAGKRGYRIAEASHLSEAARLNILSTAWEVRSRLREAFLETYAAGETEALLRGQRGIQEEYVRILEAQLAVGEASPPDVTTARLALAESRLAALDAATRNAQARVRLARAIGVPVGALDAITLSFAGLNEIRVDLHSAEIRRRALTSRSDILSALAEYAASDAAFRLELAKQYPDLNLGPNFQLDQTDAKWTLGLSFILPILNRNRGPIDEAQAKRAETAARFQALQAEVIAELESALTAGRSAAEKARAADEITENTRKREAAARARYEVGEISKLELLGVRIELASSALARLDARVKVLEAAAGIEAVLQSPLDWTEWVQRTPDRAAGPAKERTHE
jgi:outer membrane protein TolC